MGIATKPALFSLAGVETTERYNERDMVDGVNLWHQTLDIRRRHRLLGAVRTLLCAVLGLTVLGLCLTQGLHAVPLMQTGMGCHDDCWYQRPSWQPAVVLPRAPALPLPVEPYVRFALPAPDALTGHADHERAFPPRSPPMS